MIRPEQAISALLGTLPATALTPGAHMLVPPFATFLETETLQMHFSPGLCQLSPHRITELAFSVHIFPAKCLDMSLTSHRKMYVIVFKRTTVASCTKRNNTHTHTKKKKSLVQ